MLPLRAKKENRLRLFVVLCIVILMFVIECLMDTKFRSHSSYVLFVTYIDTCVPIKMYCLGLICCGVQ